MTVPIDAVSVTVYAGLAGRSGIDTDTTCSARSESYDLFGRARCIWRS